MDYHIVNAFSKNGMGGNPAAVFVNQPLSAHERQMAARQIGFSETAFLNYDNHHLSIEFYTPDKPITYCGHATIAAVNILKQQGHIAEGSYLLHTTENPIRVNIRSSTVFMEQAYPLFESAELNEAQQMLRVDPAAITTISIARNGVGFLLIELGDEKSLRKLEPDEKLITEYSRKHNLIGIYAFVPSQSKILSRMFAPYYGIKEENATGMAAGLLGGWLHSRSDEKQNNLIVEQGASTDASEKGFLQVLVEESKGNKVVKVGGEAVIKKGAELALEI